MNRSGLQDTRRSDLPCPTASTDDIFIGKMDGRPRMWSCFGFVPVF